MTGRVVGRYRILGEFPDTELNAAFAAVDVWSQREVMLLFLPDPPQEAAPDRARLLGILHRQSSIRHPHVATIFEVGETGGKSWIGCEPPRGISLSAAMKDQEFSTSESIAIAIQVAEGLAELHVHGILGIGFSPDEILLEPEGRVRVLHPALMDPSKPRGAGGHEEIMYLAPERIAGEPASEWSDVYSLGVLLHYLVTGSYPFHGRTMAELLTSIVGKNPDLAESFPYDVPQTVRDIIARALRRDKRKRYASMRDLATELKRAATALKTRTLFGIPLPSPFILFILLMLATVIAAGMILWARRPAHHHPPITVVETRNDAASNAAALVAGGFLPDQAQPVQKVVC